MNRESAPVKGAYEKLEKHFKRLMHVENILEFARWDMATKMPEGAAEARGEDLATLKVMYHEIATEPQIEDWLAEASEEELGEWEVANLKEMERIYLHATALPGHLVEALSKAGTRCEMFWRKARKEDNFAGLVPYLNEVVNLVRKKAQAKAEALGTTGYNALLDQYEPGASVEKIDALFADLEEVLPSLIEEVIEYQQSQPEVIPPEGPFPMKKQKKLALKLMEVIGFDFDHGRLDESAHPFCGGSPDDVRITTRYDEEDFLNSMMSTIHETGHAVYERGLPEKWRFQPVGQAQGMSLHESQSLLMEMQACHTRQFLSYLAPVAKDIFGGEGPAWKVENFYRLCTRVERSFIRVDADEVTYPAHVILRYQLEREMLRDNLQIKDLPGAWNEKMEQLLGVTPPHDRNGCMQDIHWMDGAFGYFPTYTLGAMTAAQLFAAAQRDNDQIRPSLAQGDFTPLLTWLRENVHRWGSSLSADEILTRATGKPLDTEAFLKHLRRRYLGQGS